MRPLPLYELLQRRRQRQAIRQRGFSMRLGQVTVSLAIVFTLALSVAIIAAGWAYASLTTDLPPITRLPTLLNPDDGLLLKPTRLYDRTGQHLLLSLIDPGADRKYLVFDPQKPDHFAPFLLQAVLNLQEPGFWQSPGISFQHLTDDQPYTIAEELVDQLLIPDEPPGLRRALRMRLLAAQITNRYGRAQVLEWYLNSAYFGRLAYGAESAARLYLNKSASDLNIAESALLAAVLRAPALNPLDAPKAALENQQQALSQFLSSGLIDQEQYKDALESLLTLRPPRVETSPANQAFLNLVIDQLARRYGRTRVELGGLQVTTSLDWDLQNQLNCTLQAQLARAQGQAEASGPGCEAVRLLPSLPSNYKSLPAGLLGSAVMLDLSNGEVLALAGDSTSLQEGSINGLHAPGTLLTPILAVSAFSRGFGPASLVWDIPGQLTASLDAATHPDGKYKGPLSLRQALANDNLAPLQQILLQISPSNAWQLAEPMGLAGLAQSPDPSQLLFDGGQVRLLDVAQAYATIANLGNQLGQRSAPGDRLEPVTLLKVIDDQGARLLDPGQPESQPVLSAPLAYLVNNVLSDEPARWASLGYPNLLEIGRPAGAKIGVTADGRQAWTAGYTPQRLVVSWIGLPDNADDALKVDPRLAEGLWHALIQYANRDLPVNNWTAPAGITTMDVCSPSGLLPTQDCPNVVSEVFLIGNEPTGPDTLYRTFQVNRETGLLATVFTPPDLVEERTYLVLPEEAQPWGKLAGLPVPPQDYDHIQPPSPLPGVTISSPAQFSVVRGQVALRGTASGDGFSYYQIQVGQGLNPEVWLSVGAQQKQAVEDGVLATWDTGSENGLFAIKLQVVRHDMRLDTAILQVTVDNTPPSVHILTPLDGQNIPANSGTIAFQVDASDTVGLQRVEFWIDGKQIDSRSAAPYNLAWTPLRGQHTLKVIAFDLAGNSSEDSIQFNVE